MLKTLIISTAAITLVASPAQARHHHRFYSYAYGAPYFGYSAYPVYGYGYPYWPHHHHYVRFYNPYVYGYRHHWRHHHDWDD